MGYQWTRYAYETPNVDLKVWLLLWEQYVFETDKLSKIHHKTEDGITLIHLCVH